MNIKINTTIKIITNILNKTKYKDLSMRDRS